MLVNGQKIGNESQPFIIAELSANHGGSIERAKESIIAASKTGVSAIKLQTYTPDTMTIESSRKDFLIKEGLWAGKSLYELYKEAHTPFEWHEELFDYAKQLGITIFSTPFDESAVDLLQELGAPAFKVASFEILDIPLLEKIASTKKPIFLSTGMASKSEVKEAVEAIRRISDAGLLLFHCVSSYPAPTEDSNLNNMLWLKKSFNVEVGLSDHTTTNIAALTAIGMGAVALEKHFKLDNTECGPDSSFSLDINQLYNLVVECNQAWIAKGNEEFVRPKIEAENTVFRRSLYFVKDLQVGHIITENDIRRIRPGYGISPKHFSIVIGKAVKKSIKRGEPVTWESFKN